MKKALAYLRVSGQGQVNGHGFDRQLETVQGFAKKHGFKIEGVYRDEGVSGTTDEADRPAFQDMIAAIMADGVNTIIIERLDRLARQYIIQEQLLVYLASKGISLVSADTGESITEALQGDPMKKAMIQIQATFAELEKNMLVKKLRTARERVKQERGKCEGRKGYGDTEEGRRIQAKIRALRRRSKDGHRRTWQQVADKLNADGITTLDGRKWTLHQARRAVS